MNIFAIKATFLKATIPFIINLFGLDVPVLTSVCAIIEKDNKILAINLSYHKGFALPGGGIIKEESFEQAIAREVKEETNLDIKSSRYLFSNYWIQGKLGYLSACYLVKVKDFSVLKSSEEGEPVWLTIDQILADCAYKDVEKHLLQYKKMS